MKVLLSGLFLMVGFVSPASDASSIPISYAESASSCELSAYCDFFEELGSKESEEFARACVNRKRSRLMASVAAAESEGKSTAVSRKGARGGWQIMEGDHGPVPKSVGDQADQAEKLLEELIKENHGNLEKSLQKYNGGPFNYQSQESVQFAKKVLTYVNKLPRR